MSYTEEQRITRAHQYTSVKPILDEIFTGVRDHLLEKMANTSPSLPEDVLECHRGLHNLDKLREAVRKVIDDGLSLQSAASVSRLTRG